LRSRSRSGASKAENGSSSNSRSAGLTSARQRHAPLLAERERGRPALFKSQEAETRDPFAGRILFGARGKPHVLADGEMRKQAIVLRDVGDAPRRRVERRQIPAVDGD
jgi:hypothetical protein